MYLIIVIVVFLLKLGERVPDLLEEARCLPAYSRVVTTEHVNGAGCHILMYRVVSVDPLVLLHHEDLRVHLRFLKGVASHLSLEFGCRYWVDAFDVLEGGIDLLILHLALILHEVVRLLMQEFQAIENHIQLLLSKVLFDCLVNIMRKLIN